MMRLALAALLMAAGSVTGGSGLAQGTQTGTSGVQSPRISGSEKSRGQVAQAGAGTTSGVTTGFSGPQPESSGTPGEISVPPLPDASLCKAYEATARQACEITVLQQSGN